MPRHKALDESLLEVLVFMHHKRNLSANEIAYQTNIHVRTIQKVIKLWNETGEVKAQREVRPPRYRIPGDEMDVSPLDIPRGTDAKPLSTLPRASPILQTLSWTSCK
jgi:Winged helix-turn helix